MKSMFCDRDVLGCPGTFGMNPVVLLPATLKLSELVMEGWDFSVNWFFRVSRVIHGGVASFLGTDTDRYYTRVHDSTSLFTDLFLVIIFEINM